MRYRRHAPCADYRSVECPEGSKRVHQNVAYWVPERCEICWLWLADVEKERADGIKKGHYFKSLKSWIMGFEKSKRVKGLQVIPEQYKELFFPSAPIPLLGNLFDINVEPNLILM